MRSLLIAIPVLLFAGGARAEEPISPVHPIYAHLPDEAENDITRREFTTAAGHYKLRPVEVIDIAAPPASPAGATIKTGVAKALKLAFAEALQDLDAAAAEVAGTGGADLPTATLSDLYLYRAMVTARADWNAPAAAPRTPDEARTRAFDDYLRAATLSPDRTFNPRELPPQVIEDFRRAADEVRRRPRGTLVVRGPAEAQVSLDGGPPAPIAGGVTFRDVVYGEHLVRVEELGRAPWGTALPLSAPSLELEVPARPALVLDDATAAAHARRMGAVFALVCEPKPGPGTQIELRLVDVQGVRHDSATVSVTGERGLVDAAVMRLDEEARRIMQTGLAPGGAPVAAAPDATATAPVLVAPPPAKARFNDDPAAWARDHWPLLTAAGVLLTSALILSLSVGTDRPTR